MAATDGYREVADLPAQAGASIKALETQIGVSRSVVGSGRNVTITFSCDRRRDRPLHAARDGASVHRRGPIRAWLEVELLATEAPAELGVVPDDRAAACRKRARSSTTRSWRGARARAVTDHDVAAFVDVVQDAIGAPGGHVDPLRPDVARRRRHRAVLRRSRDAADLLLARPTTCSPPLEAPCARVPRHA